MKRSRTPKGENMEETTLIYVLDKHGTPVTPTRRHKHIQKLLKRGMAVIVCHNPMTVRMKYNVGHKGPALYGGTDPGRTNIGNAVISETGEVVYKDHVETNNRDVPKRMKERKEHRQASRRGERQKRKRRARKNNTTKEFPNGRKLPGCEEPLELKDITNTEARFNNRKRKNGWITPTVRHLVETHLNMIRKIKKILPVTEWTIEANKFAFMQMEDGSVTGVDFQNGRLKGFASVNEYADYLQKGKCLCCNSPIEHHHHIVPRSKGGSDTPENIVGLCNKCHEQVHKGALSLKETGARKKYGALSVLNQAIPYIIKGLYDIFGEENVYVCSGYETKTAREVFGICKDHPEDAVCIAAIPHVSNINDNAKTHEVKQFRRHNRAIINNQRERTYCFNNKVVAKNRKPRFEQKGKALSDLGLTREETSRLTVRKSRRYYNAADRIMPGTEILYKESRYIITGQISGGRYFRAYGCEKKNIPARDCMIVRKNVGLVYV